jgi:hypothetical protein
MKMTNEQGVVKLWVVLLITMMAIAVGIGISLIGSPQASAQPTTCGETTTVGIGGVGDPDATVFKNVDVRVKYPAQLGTVETGILAFDRAVDATLAACPDTEVVAVGFSQGSVIVHRWLQRNPDVASSAVLYSDPLQKGTGVLWFWRDANFGTTPTVSVCNDTDVICNLKVSNLGGYPTEHLKYNFDPAAYAGETGIVWE